MNGWYALGAQLTESAVTLRSWLAEGPPEDEIADVLVKLFIEGLGRMCADNRRCDTQALRGLGVVHHRQRRILQALDAYAPALVRPDGGRLDPDHRV